MKRIIFLVLSFLSSSIMVYAQNVYALSSIKSKLLLYKAYSAHNIQNKNMHSTHSAHLSHYSAIVVTADSTANLSKKKIDFIKKELCKEYKIEINKINILNAYKADSGKVHFAYSSSILYGVDNVIY